MQNFACLQIQLGLLKPLVVKLPGSRYWQRQRIPTAVKIHRSAAPEELWQENGSGCLGGGYESSF